MSLLIDNPSSRCACILVLDTSGSMGGLPIAELNEGLQQFIAEVKEDDFAAQSVEVGIVTAGGYGATQQLAITSAESIQSFQPFFANGGTPLGSAVTLGLNMLEQRKNEYKRNGISYYQPWMVIISDGAPTDEWRVAAQRAQTMANEKKLVVIPVGVSGADLEILSSFSNRPAKPLAGMKFKEFFSWLSASMSRVSASVSTTSAIHLPATNGWDSI